MPENDAKSSQHVLEPPERIAEMLFGLIMVLTFTCSLSLVRSGSLAVRHMLIGGWAAMWLGELLMASSTLWAV